MSFYFQLKPREKAAANYNAKLKEKFSHHPLVRRKKVKIKCLGATISLFYPNGI